ncbi:MAG: methylated-DNA--[protein]-cysteine S-methyltransferase [bacterium]
MPKFSHKYPGLKISCGFFLTEEGWLALAGTKEGLLRLILPQRNKDYALQRLTEEVSGELIIDPSPFQTLSKELTDYFEGKKVFFNYPFDLKQATPFQRKVWETVQAIPYGETRAYGWVAEIMGKPKASRPVGQALSANPLPILIPCHRILRSDGALGGFSSGLAWKKKLLQLEGAEKFRPVRLSNTLF